MFYYVYILQSLKDSKFYTGYTENLKLRFEEHQKGYVISTRDRKPFRLVYFEGCLDKKDAIHREKYLKSYLGRMFRKNRLKSYLTGCKNS